MDDKIDLSELMIWTLPSIDAGMISSEGSSCLTA